MLRRIGFWLIGICMVIFAIYFFSKEQISKTSQAKPDFISKILSSIAYPFDFVIFSTNKFFSTLYDNYQELKITAQDVREIKSENTELKVKMKELSDLIIENNRLRELLNLSQRLSLKFMTSEALNSDPSFLYQNILISHGRKNGVQVGMGVLSEEGVAGIVMHVGDHFSHVILLTDPNSSLDAMILRTKTRGILHGGILNRMQFKYFDRGSDIVVGDQIVTSGRTGAFPSGVPIGIVTLAKPTEDGMSQIVEVKPAVDVSALSNVLILLNSNKEIEAIRKIEGEEWMEKNLGTKVEK